MSPLIAMMIPTVTKMVKDAFTKENVTESPTTTLAVVGTALGGGGLYAYSSTEEAIGASLLTGFSLALFFYNERKAKKKAKKK